MNFDFPRQIFGKYSNINFYGSPSGVSRVVSCVRTDEQTSGS